MCRLASGAATCTVKRGWIEPKPPIGTLVEPVANLSSRRRKDSSASASTCSRRRDARSALYAGQHQPCVAQCRSRENIWRVRHGGAGGLRHADLAQPAGLRRTLREAAEHGVPLPVLDVEDL